MLPANPTDDDLDDWLAAELARMTPLANEAFRAYLALPSRSLKETADLVGRDASQVRKWAMNYQWKRIAAVYDERLSKDILATAKMGMAREGLKSLVVAREIRDNPKVNPATRLKAAEWLASLVNLGPRTYQVDATNHHEDDGAAIPADQLYKLARSGRAEDLQTLVNLTTGNSTPIPDTEAISLTPTTEP